ncbi:MAG: hypothetical protein WCV55_01525 [Candidatus Paceibacterota bacterium]
MNAQKSEEVVEHKELIIFHCERPKTFAELIERVEKAFPNIPFENLVPTFGIVSIHIAMKK